MSVLDWRPCDCRCPSGEYEGYLCCGAWGHAGKHTVTCGDAVQGSVVVHEWGSLGPVRRAAVSLVEREDGRILCVWNRRYEGWSLPGGMVEEGETIEEGQRRELAEECGLETLESEEVFSGEHGLTAGAAPRPGRASIVHVFRVRAAGRPRAVEEGCPIDWLSREEFVQRSPFGTFYAKVFAVLPLP